MINITQICRYDYEKDSWDWFYKIGKDKEKSAKEEDPNVFQSFSTKLKELSND